MSEQLKDIKPFFVYLEGDKVEITQEMIDKSSPEVIEGYRRMLWAQSKRGEREKRCLNSNGTRCKEKCPTCKKIQQIDLKDPCNGLPRSLEDMEQSQCPMPSSNRFISPEDYVIKMEEYEAIHSAINSLDERKKNIIIKHFFGEQTERRLLKPLASLRELSITKKRKVLKS